MAIEFLHVWSELPYQSMPSGCFAYLQHFLHGVLHQVRLLEVQTVCMHLSAAVSSLHGLLRLVQRGDRPSRKEKLRGTGLCIAHSHGLTTALGRPQNTNKLPGARALKSPLRVDCWVFIVVQSLDRLRHPEDLPDTQLRDRLTSAVRLRLCDRTLWLLSLPQLVSESLQPCYRGQSDTTSP